GDGALGERRRNALGDVEAGGVGRIVPTRAVGKGHSDHVFNSFCSLLRTSAGKRGWSQRLSRFLRLSLAASGSASRGAGSGLVPRQRPKRHGIYHRELAGNVAGTKSSPCVPHGWQRNSRASVIQPPAHKPKRSIAWSA